MDIPIDVFRTVLLELFSEAYTGPNHAYTWFIDNKPDAGLLGTFSGLSAEAASRPSPTGSTIAAHAEHLRWSLALANAFARGENPTPNWPESWTVKAVDDAAWDELQAELKREYETLFAAMERQEDFSDPQLLTGILALMPHAAYHLGSVRQLVNAL